MEKSVNKIDNLKECFENGQYSNLEKGLAEEILFQADDLIYDAQIDEDGLNEKSISGMINNLIADEELWERINIKIYELLRKNEEKYCKNKELFEKSKVKVCSAKCIDEDNDILCYDVEINFNERKETILLEKHYHDLQEPHETWEVISDLELSDEDKNKIIQIVSEDRMSIYSNRSPKQYNQEIVEELEMEQEQKNEEEEI